LKTVDTAEIMLYYIVDGRKFAVKPLKPQQGDGVSRQLQAFGIAATLQNPRTGQKGKGNKMKGRPSTMEIYRALNSPAPLETRDIAALFGFGRTTAYQYKQRVQDSIAATGKRVDPRFLTRAQICAYEGWDWNEIKKDALTEIAAGRTVANLNTAR
jgi:hypothetical protein